jgi:hypothetical protein
VCAGTGRRAGPQGVPDLPRKQVKTRLKEISEGAWGAEAARKAIAELEAAMAATVAAAAIASTTATS